MVSHVKGDKNKSRSVTGTLAITILSTSFN